MDLKFAEWISDADTNNCVKFWKDTIGRNYISRNELFKRFMTLQTHNLQVRWVTSKIFADFVPLSLQSLTFVKNFMIIHLIVQEAVQQPPPPNIPVTLCENIYLEAIISSNRHQRTIISKLGSFPGQRKSKRKSSIEFLNFLMSSAPASDTLVSYKKYRIKAKFWRRKSDLPHFLIIIRNYLGING